MTPVYFLLPVWGEKHLSRAKHIGLASLLAPGNLPALKSPSTILIYTTREDWETLRVDPIIRVIASFAEIRPIFFEASPLPLVESKHVTMSRGHEAMLREAEKARAFAIPLFPDSLIPEGSIGGLLDLTKPGRRMVLSLGLRVAEEAATPRLRIGSGTVSASTRDLAALCMSCMHSQIKCWSAENPAYGEDILGGPWWAAPDGMIVHSIYWEPALVDFSHPWPHDVSPVQEWTIDGHYAWWNCTKPEHYYTITDSDEFLHVTTAPESEYHYDATPMKGTVVDEFRRARNYHATDPLRQELASVRFRVHGSDIDKRAWAPAERRADHVVKASYVEPRARWHLKEDFVPFCYVGSGRDRHIIRMHGQIFSIPKAKVALDFSCGEHLAHGVQLHASAEDAIRACS